MPLLEAGKYIAKACAQIVIYKTEKKALCAAILCEVVEGPHAGVKLKHTMTLIKQDQSIHTKTVDTLKEAFGWDGQNPFWLEDNDLSDKTFEIVVEDEEGMNRDGTPVLDDQGSPVYFSKVKYLNAIGSGPQMPVSANRKEVLAQFGSMFRALAGGAPVLAKAATPAAAKSVAKVPAAAPVAPKPVVAPKGHPAGPTAPTATLEDAWAELLKANPDINEQDANAKWAEAITKFAPGKTQDQLTSQEWFKVKASFEDDVPF
jgi:hypothetical protein